MDAKLIINKLKFEILPPEIDLFLRLDESLLFHKEAEYFINKLKFASIELSQELQKSFADSDLEKGAKLSYDFINHEDSKKITLDPRKVYPVKKSFILRVLALLFKKDGFLVEYFSTGANLSIYQKHSDYNDSWGIYNKFDIVVHERENELSLSVSSTDTLISNVKLDFASFSSARKYIDENAGTIVSVKNNTPENSNKIIADKNIKRQLGIKNKIKKRFYADHFDLISSVYSKLLETRNDKVKIEGGGFKTVPLENLFRVKYNKNLLIFGNNHSDVNPATGMRDGGAYFVPENAQKVKLLFIYNNTDHANNLYLGLKKGLRHFPGLLSYVGIPVSISDKKLKYANDNTLKEEFDEFLKNELSDDKYENHVALIISPFKKETATIEQSQTYFHIKERLLEKEITSQFIHEDNINSGVFHYHLPNISIAILAKIGGVPWKLKGRDYNDLIIGFNEASSEDKHLIGSAIYFDNSGRIKQVVSFPKERTRKHLIDSLKSSINRYLNENKDLNRIIIHYYKRPSSKEMMGISRLIKDEFNFNIPFALVEINDSKVKTDICFDINYSYGMPISGTYVRTLPHSNEYLLFNNLRYSERPLRPINQEEYPIKIRLYNTEKGGFTTHELIGQVYEFSRLYWKGLKQRSQPVTTQYSRFVAEYALHFKDMKVPENNISQKTTWFI